MNILCENLVSFLKQKNETISFMESCTGGFLNNEITNIEGSSDVLRVGAVTYSNEYKVKFGVNEDTIKKYTVYSIEVAREMAKSISKFAKSSIGVGITGQIGNENINKVFISIYINNNFFDYELNARGENRIQKKEYISRFVINTLIEKCENE